MAISAESIIERVMDMYPELGRHGVDVNAWFDAGKKTWMLGMALGGKELSTHVDLADLERCLVVGDCMNFGVQVGRFIENYCLRDGVCPV